MNFGTAGIREIMGDGPNKLNLNTISRITIGFAKYLKSKNKSSCCVGYDTRENSREFALRTADVLSSFDIDVYIFKETRPTPLLSFTIKNLKIDSGVMITASHNSKEYNGYKVYDHRGCQLLPEETSSIKTFIDQTSLVNEYCVNKDKINFIDSSLDDEYIKTVIEPGNNKNLEILYSPLHGTGYFIIPKALNYSGYKNIDLVTSQCVFDGKFSTIDSPNPENLDAFKEARKYKNKKYDIIILTDPDADRVAVMEDNKLFNGDELGILLFNFLVDTGKSGKLMRTFVSNDLVDRIAEKHNIEVIVTPVGFKYFGDIIDESTMFAFEDSCGYLHHNFVSDKDAISTTVLICEMAQHYKNKGKTLKDVLDDIYKEYDEIVVEKYMVNDPPLSTVGA